MPGENWRYGDMTTTPSGRIRRSETRRHCKRAERLSNLRAPRPARLPQPKPMIIKIKPADSRYERGTTGGQVMGNIMVIRIRTPPLLISCIHELTPALTNAWA